MNKNLSAKRHFKDTPAVACSEGLFPSCPEDFEPATIQSWCLAFKAPHPCSTPCFTSLGSDVVCRSRNHNQKPQDSTGAHKKNTSANVESSHSSRRNMNLISEDASIYSTPLCCSKTLRVIYCWCDDVVAARAEIHAYNADVREVMSRLSFGADRLRRRKQQELSWKWAKDSC